VEKTTRNKQEQQTNKTRTTPKMPKQKTKQKQGKVNGWSVRNVSI